MNGLANRESSKLARLVFVFVLACLALFFTKTGNAWAHSPAVERVLATEQDVYHRPPIYVGETTRDGQTGALWHATVNTEYSALLGLANADLPEGSAAITANQLDAFNDSYLLASCHGMQGYKRIGVFPAVNGDNHYYTYDELVQQHGTCRRSTIDNHDYFVPHAARATPDEGVQQETVAVLALARATDPRGIARESDNAEDRVAVLATASPTPTQEHLDAFQSAIRVARHHLEDLAVAASTAGSTSGTSSSSTASETTSSSTNAPDASSSSLTANVVTPVPSPVPDAVAASSYPHWGWWILIVILVTIGSFSFGFFTGLARPDDRGFAPYKNRIKGLEDILTALAKVFHEFYPKESWGVMDLRIVLAQAKNREELLHEIAALFTDLKGPFTSAAPVKALFQKVEKLTGELATANTTLGTLRTTIHSENVELQTAQDERDDYQRKYDASLELTTQERAWTAGLFARWEEATTQIMGILKSDILSATDVSLDDARRCGDPDLRRLGEDLRLGIASTIAVLARGHDAFTIYANQFRGFCESHALNGVPAPTFIPVDFGQPARPFLELFANDTINILRFFDEVQPLASPRPSESTAEFTIPENLREVDPSRGPISVGLSGGVRVNGRVTTLAPPALGDEATAVIVVPPSDPTITPTESSDAIGSGASRIPSYNPHDPDGQAE